MSISRRRKLAQAARRHSSQSVCKQGSLSFMWLLTLPVSQPHAVGDERAGNFLLIYIQPPIDPLLIHSVSGGNGCSARQSTSKPPKASGGCGRSASQAASLKCGKRQPHWPSQVVKKLRVSAWIMAKTPQILPSRSFSVSQEKGRSAEWQAVQSKGH